MIWKLILIQILYRICSNEQDMFFCYVEKYGALQGEGTILVSTSFIFLNYVFFQYSTILLGIKLMGFKYFFNKIRHFKLLMHISEGTYTTFNWIQQKVNKIKNIKKYIKKSITFFLGRIEKKNRKLSNSSLKRYGQKSQNWA